MTTHLTVIGATGGIGAAIVRAAEQRPELQVRAVNRGGDAPAGADTERIAADVETALGAARAVTGTDVVVMAAQPPYHDWGNGRFETMLDHVVTATADMGARLLFVDNLYALDGTEGPISESSPRTTNRKGALREALAQRLLAAHEQGRLRVAIGGFSDYFGPGPGADSTMSITMIDPALAGRRMRAIYELDVPHAFSYLPDAAEMFVTLALHQRAYGRRWVLPHAPAITQREVQRLVADAAGVPARHGRYGPAAMALAALVDRDIREVRQIRDQWEHPWEVDASAFVEAFGEHHVTPMREAIRATVTARRAQHDATTTTSTEVAA